MNRKMIKRTGAGVMLLSMLLTLTGCFFVQPDPSLEPLTISDGTLPFGTASSLPTETPAPTMIADATPTPDAWQQNSQDDWEDWSADTLPTTTPHAATTAAPGQESWQTSLSDYNAGYPVLKLGSTGDDVADLQAQLTALRYYTGTIDGRYTTETQEAVREFQEKNGLTPDGIAGRETQDMLYSSSANSSVISAEASDETYFLLKTGVTGIEVRRLQARLMELGYYSGGVDGLYSSTTADAVRAFQRANGLSADGQAGVQTQTKLYSTSAKYNTTPVATADPEASRELSLGMSGNDVYALQQRLIQLRYLDGVADGVFGIETQSALAAYQAANGLTATGTANAATLKKLNGSSKAASATIAPTSSTMHEGDSGENVYTLQARLFELGYFSGRIDGRYGSETTEAVRAFQKANGLAADGVAGRGTIKQLNSSRAVAYSAAQAEEEETSAPADASTLSTMRKGDSGDGVLALQQRLMALGYLTSADGQFGSGTDRAVKLFQEANGLTADGVAGPGTLAILFGNDAVTNDERIERLKATPTPKPEKTSSAKVTPTPKPNLNVTLQWQSKGSDVKQYQTRLVQLGYLTEKKVTGTFDQNTVDATKAFQEINGLKVDGAAGKDTLKLIYSDKALTADGSTVGD